MKNIYIKPTASIFTIMSETSVLAALSGGEADPEAPDSGLTGGGTIENGGNGDDVAPAKKHYNAWTTWDD